VLGVGEPQLGDNASENHHDREPPEVVLLLLSIRESLERYVFFFLLDAKRGDDAEVAERTSERANFREFFCHRTGEYEGFIKSRLVL